MKKQRFLQFENFSLKACKMLLSGLFISGIFLSCKKQRVADNESALSTDAGAVTEATVKTFSTNQTLSTPYTVPNDVSEIVIKANVTVKGSIIVPANRPTNLTIRGESQTTSILQGKGPADRGVHGIDASDFTKILYLKNFTGLNPDGYHMRALKAQVVAEYVSLVDNTTCTTCNTDGFSGGANSTFTNCYVSTNDDAFKVYYGNYTIKNTTIIHNKNGAVLQNGWGDNTNNATITIDNVTVKSNSTSYNQGIFGWAGGSGTITRTFNMVNGGLKISKNSSDKSPSPLYTFGAGSSNICKNKTIKITGANCSSYASTSTNTVLKNTSSTNNKVTTCQ